GVYLGMSLYSSETNYYSKSEAIYYSNYFGSTSNGSFTALAPSSGYYTLVVWKKGFLDLAFAANYNLTVSPSLSNLFVYAPSWSHTVVARNDWSATPSNCNVSPTLDGWLATTYVNGGIALSGVTNSGAFTSKFFLDDVLKYTQNYSSGLLAGTQTYTQNAYLPSIVKGGKHTLSFQIDSENQITESNETDNWTSQQFDWSPKVVNSGTGWVVDSPPPQVSAGAVYPNSEAWSFSRDSNHWWSGCAVVPTVSGLDYDIALYPNYTGSTNNFQSGLAASQLFLDRTDFVLVNGNNVPETTFCGAVLNYWGASSPGIDHEVYADNETGTYSPQQLDAVTDVLNGSVIGQPIEIFRIYEVAFFSSDIQKQYQFTLNNLSGNADLSFALYSKNGTYLALSNFYTDPSGTPAIGYSNGSGGNESFTVTIEEAGYYALVVWKDRTNDLYLDASYSLDVSLTPINLTAQTIPSGWSAPLVPRNQTGATSSDCLVTPTLDGNVSNTHWNVSMVNEGQNPTSNYFYTDYEIDDVWDFSLNGSLAANTTWTLNDFAPTVVRGGRHVLKSTVDVLNDVAETNEYDNVYTKEYVWSPLPLSAGVPVNRTSPPNWSTTGSVYGNCDGFSATMPVSKFWLGGAAVPTVTGTQVGILLYDDYTGSETGFQSYLTGANLLGGEITFVIANKNTVPTSDYQLGVTNYYNYPNADFVVEAVNEDWTTSPGIYTGLTLPANSVLDLYEITIGNGQIGQYTFTLTNTSGNANLGFSLYSKDLTYGSKFDFFIDNLGYWGYGNANTEGQGETFTVNLSEAGYYCLAVWKNGVSDVGLNATYGFSMELSPSNLTALTTPAGWSAPLVPRNTTGATSSDCLVTPTLDGNINTNYLNVTFSNDGINGTGNFGFYYYVDDVYEASGYNTLSNGNTTYHLNNWSFNNPTKGGRHVLKAEIDVFNQVAETNEFDNIFTKEYVWSPLPLTDGVPVNRTSPPNWVTTGSVYGNSDGFSATTPGGKFWLGGAAVPTVTGTQVGILLYDDYTGSETGFQTYLTGLNYLGGEITFVIANKNTVPTSDYQLGVTNYYNYLNADFVVEAVNENYVFAPPGANSNKTLPANSVLDLYEVSFAQTGTYVFTLTNTSGNANLGFSLYSKDLTYGNKFDFFVDNLGYWAYGNANTEGQGETFTVNISETGYYCLAVWKNGTSDVGLNATYGFSVLPQATTPQAITDLHIQKTGNNAVLTWSAVSGATNYKVYGSTEPNFVPAPGNLLDTVTATSYTHTNGMSANSKFFYKVTVNNTVAVSPMKKESFDLK
ncbi:hypothetical protein IT568_07770, partial [bacterium]|nr:hypothetical protein [bacterium]